MEIKPNFLLIEFFELMKLNNLITDNSYKYMSSIIRDCFTDENGKDFDNQNITKSKGNRAKKSNNFYKLEKTFSEFNKKNL